MKYNVYIFLITVFWVCSGVSGNYRSDIKDANKDFENGDYEQSLKKYMDIDVEHPGNPLVEYNIGSALYKQERYDEAIEHFEKAILDSGQELKAKANYNIGNSLYKQGVQSESAGKLDESIEKMKNAVEYYKQALHNNSSDEDVKYNIEFVQQEIKRIINKIKDQQDKQQNQDKQDQQQQNQQNQQQQGQQQKQQDQQKDNDGQQQKQQGEKEQEDQKEKDKEEQKGFKAQEDKKDKGEKDQQDQEQKQGQELSKQEAQRLLDSLPDKDKERKKQPVKRGYLGEVEKNW